VHFGETIIANDQEEEEEEVHNPMNDNNSYQKLFPLNNGYAE
jgi:hypothetical protein